MLDISPIGRVRTEFTESNRPPNQGYKADAPGTIELDSEFARGVVDFDPGDTVLVIWWASDADRDELTVEKAEGRGVFTTRSPARPNPICITPCEIRGVDGPTLTVRGVDMTDGAPVLDLKPPLDRCGDWDEYRDLRAAWERHEC